jgi:uncharacterized membrane protein
MSCRPRSRGFSAERDRSRAASVRASALWSTAGDAVDAHLRELADLMIRWVHLIAGIMWIGNSLLFNWLDRNLERSAADPEGFEGRMWMVHSGGFYDVVKKQLEPGQLPERLHWFKWQNFSTWASGILLLLVVYYQTGAGLLVDPSVRNLHPHVAMTIGLGSIVGAWIVYDVIWRSPLAKRGVIAAVISFAMLGALAFGLTRFLSGRAAYIHVGVILGTIMTGNVWFVILPSQRELVAATREGRSQEMRLNKRAKQRSIHNNYMTFPLLFAMISNHFPSTYGQSLNWLVLCVLMTGGALVRHILNIRFTWNAWLPAAGATIFTTVALLFVLTKPKAQAHMTATVAFVQARDVIKARCTQCHSDRPTDDVWKTAPVGVRFDTDEQIRALAPRIRERAAVQRSMPLGNKTQITDAERDLLGAWVEQGAKLD